MSEWTHDEIVRLLAEITPGPWVARVDKTRPDWHIVYSVKHPIDIAHIPPWMTMVVPNAQFIAAAPEIVRTLLAEIERLKEELEGWENESA